MTAEDDLIKTHCYFTYFDYALYNRGI